ncbi:squamosa promoter-binding protein 1 isoform X2 [Cicer arietinum]|uniref:squamosa promoter-binding protein 1 isoform X2 n=1 Tax=Cicer arietinum TaxID=3827 RepID=UPI003CC6D7A0
MERSEEKWSLVDEEEEESGEEGIKKRVVKGSKGAGGSSNIATCCQVENCDADLSEAKQYHRRHKVCEYHAKAPAVHISGLQQRFCQQCSRLNLLAIKIEIFLLPKEEV